MIIKKILKFYKKNWKEIIGAVISISAISVTIIQFLTYKENEFRKSLFMEQFHIYEELLEKTSVLSHYNKDTNDIKLFQNSLKEYKEFQKGKLMLVNDKRVRDKVEYFVGRADNYYISNTEKSSLQNILDSLSNCCRQSLQETFDVSLPELTLSFKEEEQITEYDTAFDNSK